MATASKEKGLAKSSNESSLQPAKSLVVVPKPLILRVLIKWLVLHCLLLDCSFCDYPGWHSKKAIASRNHVNHVSSSSWQEER